MAVETINIGTETIVNPVVAIQVEAATPQVIGRHQEASTAEEAVTHEVAITALNFSCDLRSCGRI